MNRNLIFFLVLLSIAGFACRRVPAAGLPEIMPLNEKKWVLTTGAGNGIQDTTNENGAVAGFGWPGRLTAVLNGNQYVLNVIYPGVRKITPSTVVTGYAGITGFGDSDGLSAKFNITKGLGIDGPGNICAADVNDHRIRKINFE